MNRFKKSSRTRPARRVRLRGVAMAQGIPTGRLSGRVSDSEGNGVPGVSVEVCSAALQGVRTTVTDLNGDYVLPSLPPGEYTATYTMDGFETQSRNVQARLFAGAAAGHRHVARRGHRDDRGHRRGRHRHLEGQHQRHDHFAGHPRRAAGRPHAARGRHPLAGSFGDRSGRRDHHLRRPVVGEHLLDQRRERERQPPWHSRTRSSSKTPSRRRRPRPRASRPSTGASPAASSTR